MNTTRYLWEERPLPEEEARELRAIKIRHAEERVVSLLREIQDERLAIRELRASPLPTTIKVQVTLRPGDDGYDEAPVPFPEGYAGGFKWISTPTK
jgi:hypothetical protein